MFSHLKKSLTILILSFSIVGISQATTNNVVKTLPVTTNYCHTFLKYGNPSFATKVPISKANLYLCRDGYIVAYNYLTKQPTWVAYSLTGKSVTHKIKRHDDFQPDLSISKKYRAELKDYRKSGYDRGHLAPYAAMDFNKESAKQSFLLSNMSPQKPGLNRRGWAALEKDVRFWAKSKGEIYVYTGTIYKKEKPHKFIGRHKIAVPDYFYKIIYAPKQNESIAFVMPDAFVSKKKVESYRTSINDIQNRTGLLFLTSLSNAQREILTNKVSKMWRTHF